MSKPSLRAEDFKKTKPKRRPEYLNDNQWAFCEYYLQLGNIKKAAIEAGYSPKSAQTRGTQLMQNPYIRQYLEYRYDTVDTLMVANSDEVLEFLSNVMRGKVKDQFELDASLADRIRAADMLLKRNFDITSKLENVVNIYNDIPKAHGNRGRKRDDLKTVAEYEGEYEVVDNTADAEENTDTADETEE